MAADRDPLYGTWCNMRQRCNNPNNNAFRHYGGRGITICPEWDDFHRFKADMGEKPGPDYSIDRINNDGNYEPGNCRWATRSQQIQNSRLGGTCGDNKGKTHCKHGHELTGDNVHIPPGRPDRRYCRQCEHIYWKQRWANRDKTNDYAAHRDS